VGKKKELVVEDKATGLLTLPSRELASHLTESVRGGLPFPTSGAAHPRPLVALSGPHLDAPLLLPHAAATTGAGATAGAAAGEEMRMSAASGGAAAIVPLTVDRIEWGGAANENLSHAQLE
jgi:hypothetical protein